MSLRTIDTTVVVDSEGKATIQLPPDVTPGPHRVFLTIDLPTPTEPFRIEDFPRHDIPWPFAPGETFRRDDLYGDDGR